MAFGETWLISAMIRFSSNGSRVMGEMAAATNAANRVIEAQTAKINASTLAMQRFRESATGVGVAVARSFAVAGTAISAYSAFQAANLQRTLTAIRNETGADPRKMGLVYQSVFDIANKIGVSPNEAAKSWLDISRLTAGQLSVAQMRSIAPMVEQFASTIHFNRPDVSVDEATKAGLQLVHLFRAYQPDKLVPLLDKVYRLSGLMTETPSQAVRQMSYYEPLFKGLNIDMNSSIAMMDLLDRAGFRQKVGTNVRAMLLQALGPLQLTSHAQSAKLGYLEQMGVFQHGKFAWNAPGGGVNFMGMLGSIATWDQAQRARGVPASELAQILYSVYGKQGGTVAQLMADPQMTEFLAHIRKYVENPNVSLSAGIKNRDNSEWFQAGRAWGNLEAVLTELGWITVPTLTRTFRSLGDNLHNFQHWLNQNRGAERWIAGGFVGLTGLAAGAVGLSAFAKALNFVNTGLRLLVGPAGKVSGFGNAVSGLESPLTSATGGVNGIVGALQALAGAGAGFLASPLGKLIAAGGGLVTGGLISAAQVANDRTMYGSIASKYGYRYANYLNRTFPAWQNTVNAGQIPKGALTPHDWDMLNPQRSSPRHAPEHVSQVFNVHLAPGTTAEQARNIVDVAMDQIAKALPSTRRARGSLVTGPHESFWSMGGAQPSLGLEA